MNIHNHIIGQGNPAFIIAETGQAHDGSLGAAHAYIDAVAGAGVDAVKFQTHIAAAESTLDEPFRVKFSRQDRTRYEYWQRMEFTFEQWQGLASHARDRGLVFLSSPFSVQAVDMLDKIGVPAWKIGSGETVSGNMLDVILETGKPLLVSTGMSSYPEIDTLTARFNAQNIPFALLQCTSRYPVDLKEVGLNVIQEMKKRYSCPAGLSDHSGSIFPALAAMAQGADLIEAHVVFDRRMFGPDTPASLTVEEFQVLCKARDAFHLMTSHPVNKNEMAESLREMRSMFGKSLALVRDMPAGTVLTDKMITAKKPGTGIPLDQKQSITGRILSRDVARNRLLCWEDFGE